MYVGRFLKDFGNIESMINEVFSTIFDLNNWGGMLLQAHLPFAKKLELSELGLKAQELDYKKTFERIRYHQKFRNVIAHCKFSDESAYGGIDFDFVNRKGRLSLPAGLIKEENDTLVPYELLDDLHEEAWQLINEVSLIHGACEPQEFEKSESLMQEVMEELDTGDNVIWLSTWPRPDT